MTTNKTSLLTIALKPGKGADFLSSPWMALPSRRMAYSTTFKSTSLSFRCVFPQ